MPPFGKEDEAGGLDDRPPSRAQTYVFEKYFSDLPSNIQTKWNDIIASKTPGKQLKKNEITNAAVKRDADRKTSWERSA